MGIVLPECLGVLTSYQVCLGIGDGSIFVDRNQFRRCCHQWSCVLGLEGQKKIAYGCCTDVCDGGLTGSTVISEQLRIYNDECLLFIHAKQYIS